MDRHWFPVANAAHVLSEGPADAAGVVIALHGYGQLAEALHGVLAGPLAAIGWALCCPEAPHRFYPGGARGGVGASWMTKHGREHDIAANRRYLTAVFEQLARQWPGAPLVLLGFSQGASQLWRVAHERRDLALLLAVAGDIPPELHAHHPPAMPPALLVRGNDDRVYDGARQAADAAVLAAQGWDHRQGAIAGGHELHPELATLTVRACQALVSAP